MTATTAEAPPTVTESEPKRKLKWHRVNAVHGTVSITQDGKTTLYLVDVLPHDQGPRFRCFGMDKTSGGKGVPGNYDVIIDTEGTEHSCECMDWLHRGHKRPCKHVACLLKLIERGDL